MNCLFSWNCHGFRNKLDELKTLIANHSPSCIALQETYLKPHDKSKIRRYGCIRKDNDSGERVSGGVALLISHNCPSTIIHLNTNLQAVAARIHMHQLTTICSIYLPPNETIAQTSLSHLIDQLPPPFIIIGDFNAHSPLWGCSDKNHRGEQIESLISDFSLCLLNNGDSTHFHQPTKNFYAIDLAICSPSLLPFYNFWVSNDLHNSDHFPIFLSLITNQSNSNHSVSRYIHEKADWITFTSLANITREMVQVDTNTALHNIINTIINAANSTIPRTSGKCKNRKPWWNQECQDAKKKQRKAWDTFRRYPTTDNLIHFKKSKSYARKVRRRSQRESWINYVSSITYNTPSKIVWTKAKRAMGLYTEHPISCLIENGQTISDISEISNKLAAAFSVNSSDNSYRDNFLRHKLQSERKNINFNTNSHQSYNSPFNEFELIRFLHSLRNTSPGPDGITNCMLKHLSQNSLSNLLYFYNKLWSDHTFPTAWHKAIVIPFPKPGKDATNASNYRPIALTSCLCKLFEKMVNARLTYILETRNLISPNQSGFRKGRSTPDNIIALESDIRNAFLRKNHLVSIFFDMEKAYDRTWRYGILHDLYDLGFRGNLPFFIKNFLSCRLFRVSIGNVLSHIYSQDEGVPQGSVLSVTLFSIKINNILNQLPPSVKGTLYVDDLQISCQGKDMRFIERQLQSAIRRITCWTDNNGFKFSADKTSCVHFCRKRGIHPDPDIFMDNKKINVVDCVRFLGIYFDKKLTFLPHALQLRKKCEKSLNLLKVLSNTSWGADRTTMLRIYRAVIRSKIDYACASYGSARKEVLRKLDTVHHSALRICSGAFRTSPVASLYTTCNEPSLHLIRQQLSLNYFFSVLSHPNHPLHSILLDKSLDRLYCNRPSSIPAFGLRMRSLISHTILEDSKTCIRPLFDFPPWKNFHIPFINPFKNFTKSDTTSFVYMQLFNSHREEYSDYVEVYTDGSKTIHQIGCAFICSSDSHDFKLHPSCSVFTAEILAIIQAFDFISHQENKNFIIYSDSMSVLATLQSGKTHHSLISTALKKYHYLQDHGYNIMLSWIPAHAGFPGNEAADRLAKSATHPLTHPIPYTDIKHTIKILSLNKWHSDWNSEINNKLHSVQPSISIWPSLPIRKLDVILTRLRIGHTRVTHKHLLLGEIAPICFHCNCHLTIKHLLTECTGLTSYYDRYFNSSTLSLSTLLGEHPHPSIFAFLKSTGFYSLI